MDAFLKIYLPIFLAAFIAWVFVVPSLKVYKKTGINPFRFATKQNPTHDYVGNSMKVFILLLLLAVGVYSASETAYQYLAPFHYLELPALKITGLIFGHISLIGIKVAQRQMRLSWRIGIDYENKTKLVTSGLFSVSRNPIYLFLLLGLVGTFLILPNALTFAILFAAFLVLHITMRLEEEFLQKQHGEAYIDYQKSVRRLI
jgi:protein-S-isoprenylcysteine O-methyltransferase Ste14